MANQISAISATGTINFLTKASTDTTTLVAVSGTFTTLSFTFNGTLDGTNWFPIPALTEAKAAIVTGTVTVTDSTVTAWRIPSDGLVGIQVSTTGPATGTANFTFQSGSFVGSGFQANAGTSFTSTFIDTNSAVALNIGPTNATSVAITPNTTVAGTLGVTGATTLAAVSATSITATGTVALTNNMTITDAKNVVLASGTGTKIGTATTQKLGFYNATPVVQPAASVDVTTGAAGSTTNVFLNTTFTGAAGTAAYTIGGIATALKALGLLAP